MKQPHLSTRAMMIFFVLALAVPSYAVDDCPAGAMKHAALTGLDHASMEAAVRASFVGLYHREPTGVPGSGPDDLGFWIATFDHYGQYGDAICRAGWNAYAELRLSGAALGDPALGDQPARFLPATVPPIGIPPPIVVAPPLPSTDLTNFSLRFDRLDQQIADLRASIEQFHDEVRLNWKAVVKKVSEYAALIVPALLAGRASK